MNIQPLFCNACNFNCDKEHYKSDWHLFNVRRKCLFLAPVSKQIFDESTKEEEVVSVGEGKLKCSLCNKIFKSLQSYQQHLNTNKHKKNLELSTSLASNIHNINEDIKSNNNLEIKENADDNLYACLFCHANNTNKFIDLDSLLKHLNSSHSFFIPFLQYVLNSEGLINYLNLKITTKFQCIYCSSAFSDVASVRKHMNDKGHCMIDIENDFDSLSQFYDFPANESDESDSEEVKNLSLIAVNTNNSLISPNKEKIDFGPITDIGEIQLPNGKILAHRDNLIYYKQRVRPENHDQLILISKSEGLKFKQSFKTVVFDNKFLDYERRKAKQFKRLNNIHRMHLQSQIGL